MVTKIILIISFFIVMILGIAVGETKYFEENFKSLFLNLFISKELENPPIFEENPSEFIDIFNKKDVQQKRTEIVRHIWKTGDNIPKTNVPELIEINIEDTRFDGIENLKQIDRLTIEMEHNINSVAYHFIPIESNNKIIIYVQGHDGGFILGKKTIEYFLNEGFSVMSFSMPLIGMNNQPIIDTEVGKIKFLSHKYFEFLEKDDFSSLIYFFEPINSSLNYLDRNFDYTEYNAIGISGGGWTVTLYSAIDERVSNTFSIAGGVPFFMRSLDKNFGDYEQRFNEFYEISNYLEFYLMASLGDERKYIQIFNKFDPCCFSGDKFYLYEDDIKNGVSNIGNGFFAIYVDEETRLHEISDLSLDKIMVELKN
jgi:hypothetical protein